MDSLRLCLLALSCFILVTAVVGDCVEKEFTGCNQVGKQCVCFTKTVCHNPFAFRDVRRCQRALFGDSCRKNACENKGVCVQTKHHDDVYLCKCEGTGYYGHRCQTKCPKDLSTVSNEDRFDAKACLF